MVIRFRPQRSRLVKYRGYNVPEGWFGRGDNQIQITKVRNQPLYDLTYNLDGMSETHRISENDLFYYLEQSQYYNGKEALFRSTYWSTEEGKQQQMEAEDRNFYVALQRNKSISWEQQGYLMKLWEELPDDKRWHFFNYNYSLVEKVFNYVEGKSDNLLNENSPTYEDDIETANLLQKKLESYFTKKRLKEIKKELME